MATVFEEYIAEEQLSVVRFFFCGQEGLAQNIFRRNVSCLLWEVFVA
jgi:hypothetical protein